jgi:hypothetical protein
MQIQSSEMTFGIMQMPVFGVIHTDVADDAHEPALLVAE